MINTLAVESTRYYTDHGGRGGPVRQCVYSYRPVAAEVDPVQRCSGSGSDRTLTLPGSWVHQPKQPVPATFITRRASSLLGWYGRHPVRSVHAYEHSLWKHSASRYAARQRGDRGSPSGWPGHLQA